MTEYDRMNAGLLYDPDDKDILTDQAECQRKLREFNTIEPYDAEKRTAAMKDMLAECGEGNFLQGPVYANWGCSHVHIGSHIYANFNLTLVDDGHIYIGDWVQFGPNVTIVTAAHPILSDLRRDMERLLQYNRDVHIEDGAWIGAGVVILPGVTIGKNSVIGAGSIVTKDIPANVVAVGNPCRVMRGFTERDREFYYKNDRIDWDEINRRYK